ncbi:MAG: polysaccharide biosynthesis/export family protein [Gemmataceae bacterium]|nr:polysaccharide biosynthesis/export family protein [Gemmataceae bacterium]MDW8243266.1 polysaccharide biosynthesis/export family protein [Thermogemmata sp.]
MSRACRFMIGLLTAAVAWACSGCASVTNPVADGIPVRRLPEEILGRPKSDFRPIPLNLLRINNPPEYRLDKGDVLAIVADEILTRVDQPIPVQFTPGGERPAVQGLPVPVQEDGTIQLPQLDPIPVKGRTLKEVREAILRQIEEKKLLQPGKGRVSVDLLQPRRYRVLVVREDAQPLTPQFAAAGNVSAVIGGTKRGAAYAVLLEPGRNDLLQALTLTGGPPGLEAKNEIIIRRGAYDPANPTKGYVRIPLRLPPDQPIPFTEQDITLNDGDTVYIEARDTEVYYVAGLAGATQVPLPRDYDLRVVEALAQIRAPLINGSFSQNAFVALAVQSGLGNPNPSLVTVIRRLPNGQQIRIRVDLNEAYRDLRENILIQPGDLIVLQERPSEAFVRYLTQTFRLTTTWQIIHSPRFNQVGIGNNP